MSSNEQTDLREKREPADEDVVAHRYMTDEPGEEDPEKRKKRESEAPEGDEFGKRKR